MGVVLLLKKRGRSAFTSVDAKLVRALASQAAVSAGHLQLYEESKEMFFSTVWSLASAVDAKDAYTHGHSQRVAKYSSSSRRRSALKTLARSEHLELLAVLPEASAERRATRRPC